MTDAATFHARPSPLLIRRLLALFYDLWPSLALWMLTAVPFVLLDVALNGGNDRHNIAPYSLLGWLLWLGRFFFLWI